jgi:hypothetical protein
MPTQDRILTGSASAGARCLNNVKLEEGKQGEAHGQQ